VFTNIPQPTSAQNPRTFDSYKCELLFNGEVLSHATCFIHEQSGSHYLISNWHVFAGINPITGKSMHKSGHSPTHIRVYFLKTATLEPVPVEFDLGSNEYASKWKWLEHPEGRSVDIGALPIVLRNDLLMRPIHLGDQDRFCELAVAATVYICGFPVGIGHGATGALWKRGSIASEPFLEFDKLPRFLVDTATREGMSGSPVYLATDFVIAGDLSKIQKGHPDYQRPWHTSPIFAFVGVYSGRLGNEEFKAQLGVVWKNGAIGQIVDLGQPPNH